MIDKCPHCGKIHCIKLDCFYKVESHGSSWFHVPCRHCNKMLRVRIERRVRLTSVEKSNVAIENSDF